MGKCRCCFGKGRVPTDKRLKKIGGVVFSYACLYCGGRGYRGELG